MLLKIADPINIIGNVLKEITAQQDVTRILNEIKRMSDSEKRTLQRAVKQLAPELARFPGIRFSEDMMVNAAISKKLIPALSLLLALVGTGAAKVTEIADTTKPLETTTGESIDKADIPKLVLKMAPIQRMLEEEEEKAFTVDPTIGPKVPAKAPSKLAPKAPGFSA